jgi:hypothetical protein
MILSFFILYSFTITFVIICQWRSKDTKKKNDTNELPLSLPEPKEKTVPNRYTSIPLSSPDSNLDIFELETELETFL